ncbi:hypothetical protein P148_SR1C00001G0708 [candidate division SR1 bacterium RAAC1_SR1_1]|nr:hypothetical protein P148_SR1C00001G0708 [candidate division SR1 bacterium RAAC1_SR1_1]
MKQKIFLGIGILLCSIIGFSIYNEFMTNHTYYYTMFSDRTNWKIMIRGIIAILIPLGYILRNKQFSLKKFLITRLPAGLTIFGLAHIIIKEGIIGSSGFVMIIINTLLLYFLGLYLILGITSVGHMINKYRIRLPQQRIQELFLNFGIGLGAFLLIIKVLVSFTILYGAVTWLLFIGLGVAIYFFRKDLIKYQLIIEEQFDSIKQSSLKKDPILWIGLVLVAISLLYYFYGFHLSFIPYSTAWDANHAYMYVPKVIAENHGVLRGNLGVAATPPELRHGFITFWFSLIGAIKWFWLGPDTVAVAMNFLSGIFTLILGLGTIKEIINYFTKKETTGTKIAFYLGRFLLILWLTSGMGAFLVFVDNKTDLGVMAITMLGMLSGLIFLNYIKNNNEPRQKETLKYIVISGVFFALATMAKPTAFIDIVLFGLLLVALWINSVIAIGFGVIVTGMTGILQIANARDLISQETGKRVVIAGIIIVICGIIYTYFQKHFKNLKTTLINIGIWVGSILITLILFKGTHLIYSQIQNNDFGGGNFVKALLLATTGENKLEDQTTIDQLQKNKLGLETCEAMSFTKEELEKNKKKSIVGNEDVGRYVGYGWKEFSKGDGLNIGYGILRLIYPQNDTCYGLNKNAKILCKNSNMVLSFNIPGLKGVLNTLDSDSESYKVLKKALQNAENKGQVTSAVEYRDEILMIKQYYESRSIKTENGKVFVPYRYIIPLNISFNWSLQNLSSYYTDIGFIWLFAMAFIIFGLIYGCIKKDKTLISISSIAILGWAIWWMIGGGILWYGLGLIIRTILSAIMYVNQIFDDSTEDTEKNMLYFFLFLFAIWGIIQLFFNFIRISSQGSGGPFARYKMNTGKTIELDANLQQKESIVNKYDWKDVFDLQFPHYNKFIELVKERKDEDGVFIAGTYIQYFLHNQRNIKQDGMLGRLREEMSDNDSCKTSQRLKNANIKYLVIDPNIGTVGMGEGNETLFHRFFAKLDPVSGKIESHGVISMLMKMKQEGFLDLINTNNLGTKYALELDDNKLKESFGQTLSQEDLIFTRAKLSVARYFQDANNYINFIANMFVERIPTGKAIGDIADVYGKIIDEEKVQTAANTLLQSGQVTTQLLQQTTQNLSQDERLILAQYLSLFNLKRSENAKLQEAVNGILGQSLGGSSQVIVLELL